MAKKSKTEKEFVPFEETAKIKKLKLLVTIVNQNQADFFINLLKKNECGVQVQFHGHGTASSQISDLMGIGETDKEVLIGVVKEEKLPEIFEQIEQRFSLSRRAKGLAFTLPFTSVVGVSIYKYLTNSTELIRGK